MHVTINRAFELDLLDERVLADIGVARREGTGPFAAYERLPEMPVRKPRRPAGPRWFFSMLRQLG